MCYLSFYSKKSKLEMLKYLQVVDLTLLQRLKTNLRGKDKLCFGQATSKTEIDHLEEIRNRYPVWGKIMTSLTSSGEINGAMAEFLVSIIEHTENLYKSTATRNNDDYYDRKGGEIGSQHFPNFPLVKERACYEKQCMVEDKRSLKFMCEKNFPNHTALSPGLMVMTCACPKKVVYGFSLMTSGESPQIIFDIVMSRFPEDYSPNIIYDNACKTKEFGLNRETKRFMGLQITCDKFHENNHTACGESFKSSEYITLREKNTQACEQTNAKLRTIASSCTFMNPDMYMRALTLYLGYQNISKGG